MNVFQIAEYLGFIKVRPDGAKEVDWHAMGDALGTVTPARPPRPMTNETWARYLGIDL